MCGITAIINKNSLTAGSLSKAKAIAAHRGPDDEGFPLWRPGDKARAYAGADTAPAKRNFPSAPGVS
ncbi:MAG: hypothetical protein H6557_28485 [Lewinellaceae bacterium]|nr:hypothetical protein [Phaeodactylibacter sp.]MCB9040583.1 hypothetical protein [Lewinellaceae bacterium]